MPDQPGRQTTPERLAATECSDPHCSSYPGVCCDPRHAGRTATPDPLVLLASVRAELEQMPSREWTCSLCGQVFFGRRFECQCRAKAEGRVSSSKDDIEVAMTPEPGREATPEEGTSECPHCGTYYGPQTPCESPAARTAAPDA